MTVDGSVRQREYSPYDITSHGSWDQSFDERDRILAAPGSFDLSRSPNPHLGFGGGGPHFCLGNQIAEGELRNLFHELLTRLKQVLVR